MEAARQMPDHLATELETYERLLPSLLKDEGKFAVVKGANLVGIFDTYNDALSEGYKVAKMEPFLVKQISRTESISYFSRDIGATCLTSTS